MKALTRILLASITLVLFVGCGDESATGTPKLINTPPPLDVPKPTDTPQPTPTLEPASMPPATTESEPLATSTATNTPAPPVVAPTDSPPEPNPCADLGGELEIRVLAGPAEVVGLEPFAIGSIPFAVTTSEAPFVVMGGGPVSYADVLTAEWGTYEVTMELQNTISGECVPSGASGGGELVLDLEMTGNQLVKVDAEGFQGEYPWSGSHTFNLPFPLEEGATVEGEGFAIMLHLNNP